MKVYSYNPDTGELFGEKEARLSPLDKKLGKDVFMIPRDSTIVAPPAEQAGYKRAWDGEKWTQKQIHTVTKRINKKLHPQKILSEIKTAFPDLDIEIEGDIEGDSARDLIFKNLPNTQENLDKLDSLIASHKSKETDLEKIGEPQLTAFKILIQEIRKTSPTFPTFVEFERLISESIGE